MKPSSIGWSWTARDGTQTTLWCEVDEINERTRAETREKAMKWGYPGHAGGRWNYFVSDFHNWLAKHGLTRCQCHPRVRRHRPKEV